MEFIWNDGGRAACGYVGLTGDCVTRSIAIATGKVYRDVYDEIGSRSLKTPRTGVVTSVSAAYLAEIGWQYSPGNERRFAEIDLPKGVAIVHLVDEHERRSGHFCTVIDHVIHDTWNPREDECYLVKGFWTSPQLQTDSNSLARGPKRRVSREQELTQREFDKILRRLRALDNTASNDASTEGEKRNALRMMQNLMLAHNLSRDDIRDDDNTEMVQFTRIACPVNGSRACNWEKSLAFYVTQAVFPTVQFYRGTRGHRTLFWFYGPLTDVENCIALFRELLLTIATAAHLQYGGYVRGSGASYAEGYVKGLPRGEAETTASAASMEQAVRQGALIQTRTLALHSAAKQWLGSECNVHLVRGSGSGRFQHDPSAENRGKQHGAQHEINLPGRPKRIAQR